MTPHTPHLRRDALKALALASLALCTFAPTAMAQGAFPNKPITLVVTYPPGGGADAMARLIAPKMGEALGQAVIIENKPGASGQIGASAVAKAAPDGYTLMLDASSFSANPALYPKLPYDSLKAFKPIGVVALFPNVVLVNANFPAKNIAELTAAARKSKEAVSYASSGNGSAQHLAGALFESAAKVDMVHVPYKGGGPALNDVIGGQVPLFFGNLASTLQHVQSGRLRALAVTSGKRAAMLPEVPTLAEAGVPGFESYNWQGIIVPAGTPVEITTKLNKVLNEVLLDPEVQRAIIESGGQPGSGSAEDFGRFITAERAKWSKVIQQAQIKAE